MWWCQRVLMCWWCGRSKKQEKGEKELILQDDTSSTVWVCMSTNSSTKVLVLDATQPTELLDSFYACNTHVICIASVPGRLSVHVMLEFFLEFLFMRSFLLFQVCWKQITQEEMGHPKTQRPVKVMACHWLAALPVWAQQAAMVPWQQKGSPPSLRLPAQVSLTSWWSTVECQAQVVPQLTSCNYSTGGPLQFLSLFYNTYNMGIK